MSDFFDNLKSKGAKLAESTKKVAGDLVDKGKMEMTKFTLEKDLANAQRQLGIYVYECRNGGSEPDKMAALIADIDDINSKLDDLDDKGEGAENVKSICPQCGAELSEGAMFCVRCGAKLSDE